MQGRVVTACVSMAPTWLDRLLPDEFTPQVVYRPGTGWWAQIQRRGFSGAYEKTPTLTRWGAKRKARRSARRLNRFYGRGWIA